MNGFTEEDLSPDEIAAQRAVYGPFTARIRQLVDAAIRTEVSPDVIRELDVDLEKMVARLQERQAEGPFGLRYDGNGVTRAWGNAVIGLRNAVAPPLDVKREADGTVWDEFSLGSAYEGPPGLVHGGVISMLLDHVLGMVSGSSGKPRMTAWVKVSYHRPTPLGPLRIEAEVDRVEGFKTHAVGRILCDDEVTADAEGLFVLPRWARDE
jgi:uncharacterized protein (TIGR00369 family)